MHFAGTDAPPISSPAAVQTEVEALEEADPPADPTQSTAPSVPSRSAAATLQTTASGHASKAQPSPPAPLVPVNPLPAWHQACLAGLLNLTVLQGDFKLGKQLGGGCFGSVWSMTWQGKTYAIKVPQAAHGTCEGLEGFIREAQITQRVAGPGVVRQEGVFTSVGQLAAFQPTWLRSPVCTGILLEHMAGGSLLANNRRLKQLGIRMTYDQQMGVMYQLCSTLARTHRLGYTHHDIKGDNILLEEELGPFNGRMPLVKLADWGVARPNGESCVGTPGYSAPEVHTAPLPQPQWAFRRPLCAISGE
ncbi:hypothetical protein WJX84_007222 [Apatococcus fuscideae]|uniref:Protein kinase domain-containing protein n=1 Tax=Apatococcus fuscideae TaxID=2026836 RepID=A0AAW1TI46_9CHLO